MKNHMIYLLYSFVHLLPSELYTQNTSSSLLQVNSYNMVKEICCTAVSYDFSNLDIVQFNCCIYAGTEVRHVCKILQKQA